MQGNPWQLIGDDQMNSIARLGKFGLENGLVDPKQAIQSALNMDNMKTELFSVPQTPNPGGAMPNRVGSKIGFERRGEQKRVRQRKTLSNRDPDDIKLAEKLAQGIDPGYAQDELGNTVYQDEPLMDPQGNPIMRPDGTQAMGSSDRPVLDPSRDVVDPEHPIQQQKAGLERLKEMLQAQIEHSPVQMDLSPIARLLDSTYGTKLSQGYEPRRPDFAKFLGSADELQKRQADITKQVKEYAQNTLRGGSSMDTLSYLLADKLSQAQDNTPKSKGGANPPETKLWQAWEKYSKPNREALEASQNALATLTSGSKVGLEAFKNFMARASGEKGPLSVDDVKRFQGSQALKDQVDRAWMKYNSGKMTERDQSDMSLLASAYVDFRRGLLEYDSDYFTNQVGPTAFQVSPTATRTIIRPAKGYGLPEKPKGPAPKSFKDTILEEMRKSPKPAAKASPAPAASPKPKTFKESLMDMLGKGK